MIRRLPQPFSWRPCISYSHEIVWMTRPCSASLSMTPSASFPRRCSVFDGTGKRRAPDELRILKAVGRRPYHQRLYAVSDDSSNKRTQLFPVDLNAIVNGGLVCVLIECVTVDETLFSCSQRFYFCRFCAALSKFSSFPLEQEEPSETVAASDTARSTPPGDLERDASGPGWPRPVRFVHALRVLGDNARALTAVCKAQPADHSSRARLSRLCESAHRSSSPIYTIFGFRSRSQIRSGRR